MIDIRNSLDILTTGSYNKSYEKTPNLININIRIGKGIRLNKYQDIINPSFNLVRIR